MIARCWCGDGEVVTVCCRDQQWAEQRTAVGRTADRAAAEPTDGATGPPAALTQENLRAFTKEQRVKHESKERALPSASVLMIQSKLNKSSNLFPI